MAGPPGTNSADLPLRAYREFPAGYDHDPVTAWRWMADHYAFEAVQAGAKCVMRFLDGQDTADA
jgi:hypothetical protein